MGTAIMADPDRIAQALTNLISNAVKYSPKDSAVVLSARRMNGTVRICVTDKGPGIPEKFHSQVFARFAQADSAEARRKGGTGLGLSISKAIAEAHGGSIGFKSIEGRGATFFIDIPARCKPRAAEATERRALAS
jgi:signal transduction histidine kinase